MAPLSNYVSLTITQDSVGIARAGFGVPLILSANAAWAERTRTYNSLADVAVDFPSTTGPEYLAAQAIFSQSPRPSSIKIGRSALPPTQKYTLTPVVQNSHTYTLYLKGDGVTATTCTYTSDASATATEICDAMRTAINAATGGNMTGTGTTTLIVTADAAAEWFSIEVDTVNDWAIVQDHADPGVATDLAAIAVADNDWYCLLTLYNSDAYVKAAAAWVESNKKIYIVDVNDSLSITAASDGTQGTLDDLLTLGYARTMGAYHPAPDQMLSAAWAGKVLPLTPGSETFALKNLSGVAAVSLTATQRTNLVTRRANSMETVAGQKVTFYGTVFNTTRAFLDVTRGLDWVEDDMSKAVFEVLVGASKVPYTDAGVSLVESAVKASLQRTVAAGIAADSPAPVVTVPKVADVSVGNKSARILPDVKFSFTLAGAIHKVVVSGVVSV